MAPMIKTNFGFSTSVCSDALDWGPTDGFSEHGSLRNSAPTSCKHNIARIKDARGRGTQKQFYRCQSDNDKVYPWLSQLSEKKIINGTQYISDRSIAEEQRGGKTLSGVNGLGHKKATLKQHMLK